MKVFKRYQYWSRDGIVWTNWFEISSIKTEEDLKRIQKDEKDIIKKTHLLVDYKKTYSK